MAAKNCEAIVSVSGATAEAYLVCPDGSPTRPAATSALRWEVGAMLPAGGRVRSWDRIAGSHPARTRGDGAWAESAWTDAPSVEASARTPTRPLPVRRARSPAREALPR